MGSPWHQLASHVVRVGPDLPLTWRTPQGQSTDSPQLLFLPGIGSDGRSWFRQGPLGHIGRLAYFDNPTHVPKAPYNFDILALLLRDAVRQLCDRPPVPIIGASFGGMLALTYALTWPDAVSGLVLCGSTADGRWLRWPLGLGARLMANVPPALFRMGAPVMGRVSALRDAQNKEGQELFVEQTLDLAADTYARRIGAVAQLRLADRLHEVQVPTLILHGTRDQTVSVRNSLLMDKRIPHARLRLRRGGRHNLYLNAPDWFNGQVGDWLLSNSLP